MFNLRVKKGKAEALPPGVIPTKFKRYVDKKHKRLNELSAESKVVAAINKALAQQGSSDGANYYVADNTIWCPDLQVTEGKRDNPHGRGSVKQNSYSASGRFKIGKVYGNDLAFGIMQFSIKFRDGEDDMGLPDLVIEEASIDELPKNTPLHG